MRMAVCAFISPRIFTSADSCEKATKQLINNFNLLVSAAHRREINFTYDLIRLGTSTTIHVITETESCDYPPFNFSCALIDSSEHP